MERRSLVENDGPPADKTHISHWPWRADLGDSSNGKSYVFRNIYVSKNTKGCSGNDLSLVVDRSRKRAEKWNKSVYLIRIQNESCEPRNDFS